MTFSVEAILIPLVREYIKIYFPIFQNIMSMLFEPGIFFFFFIKISIAWKLSYLEKLNFFGKQRIAFTLAGQNILGNSVKIKEVL